MSETTNRLPRQTRDSFDAAAVRVMLLRGDEPPQGWVSLVDEACHRIARLEGIADGR